MSPGWITPAQLTLFAQEETDAHRVFSSRETWIERFGSDLLISHQLPDTLDETLAQLEIWEQETGFTASRVFSRFVPIQNADRHAPQQVRGEVAQSLTAITREHGLQFEVDFSAGYSVGFFIDQRANRQYLRRFSPKRVLNCFAYTCSFSVAAAASGAETLSIDLSKKSLTRGSENFRLNNIDPTAGHWFLADDVIDVLPRLERKGELFDALILDPPTFSRGNKGRRWQVERDFDDLLLRALALAAPRARILLSTNCTRMSRQALEISARHAFRATRRSGSFHSEPALPDIPPTLSAQTLWILLKT